MLNASDAYPAGFYILPQKKPTRTTRMGFWRPLSQKTYFIRTIFLA
jgi:hypothetical protein